jgi:hypothetical protein
MSEVKQIKKVEFKQAWNGPNGEVFYHDVWLGEDAKAWNIGAKEKNPDFLSVGKELTFEVKDAAKRSIKRVNPMPVFGKGGGGGFDGTGAMVGNALTNAVTLIVHDKAELKDIEALAKRICQISLDLKTQFSNDK